MKDNKKAMLEALIALAWADGRVTSEETEVVEALIDSFEADETTSCELRAWAVEPRTLNDIDFASIEEEDGEMLLCQAVLLTFVDGEQSDKELELLDAFVEKLGMDAQHADAVIESAAHRARQLYEELRD